MFNKSVFKTKYVISCGQFALPTWTNNILLELDCGEGQGIDPHLRDLRGKMFAVT